jgi:hypothetical protein
MRMRTKGKLQLLLTLLRWLQLLLALLHARARSRPLPRATLTTVLLMTRGCLQSQTLRLPLLPSLRRSPLRTQGRHLLC